MKVPREFFPLKIVFLKVSLTILRRYIILSNLHIFLNVHKFCQLGIIFRTIIFEILTLTIAESKAVTVRSSSMTQLFERLLPS